MEDILLYSKTKLFGKLLSFLPRYMYNNWSVFNKAHLTFSAIYGDGNSHDSFGYMIEEV